MVHEEMQRLIQHCGQDVERDMIRFPNLHERIIAVMTDLLRKRLQPTNAMVENLIKAELSYINTKHPEFHDVYLAGEISNKEEENNKNASAVQDDNISSAATNNVMPDKVS